jgi:Flp pilus assembly protein TadD
LYQQTLQLREKVLGKEHVDTRHSKNTLALVLDQQGKHNEAEKLYQQTLQFMEGAPEDPNTLDCMNNLAVLLYNQGEYDEAEKLHRQTLQLKEKVLGKEHPSTLQSMSNLDLVLKSQSKND